MVQLLKILPLVLTVGGGVAAAKYSGQFFNRVVNKIKVLVTGMEIAKIGDEVRFHFLDTGEVPGTTGGQEEFAEFLRKNFKPYWGGRDPSTDLWSNPYMIETANTAESGMISSLGPNGQSDDCMVLNGETQQLQADLENLAAGAASDLPADSDSAAQAAAEEAALAALPDDLCLTFEFALRDTPFRRLKE
jgi:hypothetical protein